MFIVDLIRILSVLLAIVGTTFLIPAGVAVYCGEFDVISSFLVPMLVSWILCAAMMFFSENERFLLTSGKLTLLWHAAGFLQVSLE